MVNKRSYAVLTFGLLLLAQVSVPTASAIAFRAERDSAVSVPARPIKYTPVEIPAAELPTEPDTPEPFLYVVDDGDRDFRTRGHWSVVPFGGFQSDFRYASPQKSKKITAEAEWRFSSLRSGTYDVLVTWDAFPGLAFVDQTKAPSGPTYFRRSWQSLGRVEVPENGKILVSLSNQAGGYIVADAVALRPVSTPEYEANLTLSVSYDDRTAPGETLTYTLYLNNMGPNTAEQARVFSKISEHLKFDPANSDPGCVISEDGRFLDCDFGNMEARSETKKTVAFTVPDFVECNRTLYNEFRAMSETPDLHTGNNTVPTKVFVECGGSSEADLFLNVKTPAMVLPGAPLTYTLNLGNSGPDFSENSRVILSNLSMWLHFDKEASDPRCKEISSAIPGEEAEEFSHAILCGFGDMGPRTGTIAPVSFKVDPDAPCDTGIRQLVESDSDTNDLNPYNNNADTKVLIQCLLEYDD